MVTFNSNTEETATDCNKFLCFKLAPKGRFLDTTSAKFPEVTEMLSLLSINFTSFSKTGLFF